MKKLLILIFLASCASPNSNINNNIKLNFNDDLSFDDFNQLLIQYAEKNIYPNIDK
mgnify:CR=1 FL=1